MVRFPTRLAPALLVVALQALAPLPAAAQLGGLAKRAAKKALGDRIEDALPFTPKAAPEFDDRVLEITRPFVEGLLAGFDAEISFAKDASREYQDSVKSFERQHDAWEKAVEGYDEALERYEPCRERFQERERTTQEANEARMDKAVSDMDDEELEQRLLDLATRGEKLARDLEAGRNDPELQRQWEEYQRDVQIVTVEQQRRVMLAMSGAVAEARRASTEDPRLVEACGKKPERPAEPMSSLSGPEGVLAARGAEAAGMTPTQYAIMRERVIYWAKSDRRPEDMGFTQDEIDILNASSDQVMDVVERMRKAKVPL